MRTAVFLRVVIGVLSTLLAWSPAACAGKRVALVIGNSAYEIAPLANPANDAVAIAEALRDMKFNTVILRTDLTGEGMRAALREIGRAVTGAEIAVIFFAGHGVEMAGRNYLLPIDSKLIRASDIELEAINLDTLLQQLDGAVQLKLVFLDACRNNPFQPVGSKRSFARGLARVEPEDNTLVAFAAKEGTTADDGSRGKNSPFTTALLKHIVTPDLEIRLMLGRVRDDVIASTADQQRPHIYGTLGGSAISLVPGTGTVSGASPTPSATVTNEILDRLKAAEQAKERLEVQLAEDARMRGDAEKAAAEAKKIDQLRAEIEARKRRQEPGQQAMLTPNPQPSGPASIADSGPARPRSAGEKCDSGNTLTVCASSTLRSQFGNSYLPRNLIDGSKSTAWVEGVNGDGRGQSVSFEFEAPRVVLKVVINNGYGKNQDIFRKNGRVKSGELIFSDGERVAFALEDRPDQQVIQLQRPVKASWIQLKVTSVYAGAKYQDLAISEIRIVGP